MLPTMDKMIDHQYTENGARNNISNHNQMKAYCESYLNQLKKLHLIDNFHLNFEDSGKILAGLVSEFYQGILD